MANFKSAMNRIHAEEELIEKTECRVRSELAKQKGGKVVKLKSRRRFPRKVLAMAACIAVLVCGLSLGGYAYYKTPVAYLSVDINPSIELGVNAFQVVVSAKAYNADGQLILEGQKVLNRNVESAACALVKAASEKGFVKQDGSTIISVTSETNDGELADKLQEDAEEGANQAIWARGDTAVVYKDNVALARRAEAENLGITPGKLNLIQKLQALDPTATVDQYKDATVTSIMKKIIELKKSAKISNGNGNKEKNGTSSQTSSGQDSEVSSAGSAGSASSEASVVRNQERVRTEAMEKIEKAVENSEKNQKNSKAQNNGSSAAAGKSKNENGKKASSSAAASLSSTSSAGEKSGNGQNGNGK